MNRYKETSETWNKIAALYQERFMDLDIYNDTYDFVCSSLPKKNSNILEIGCGPGNITKYLLAKRPDFNITGIDIAPNMIELAKINNPTASFEILDMRNISNLYSKYDGIICGFCLPYISQLDGEKFIHECSNLLNDNGLIYLSFVEGDPGNSGFQVGSSGDRTYFYFHRLDELTEQVRANKFDDMKIFKVEFVRTESQREIHTILIAKKISKN